MKLEIRNAVCGYGKNMVVKKASLEINSGETLCVLGPNGVGKTTFLKAILGLLKLSQGEIIINGKDISAYSKMELAKIIGYVPQSHVPPFPYTVYDVVLMGRNAHIGLFSSPTKKDMQIADDILNTLDIYHLKDRVYTQISGGERQLVLIARALAQECQLLVMDEPTSNLDFGNSIKVLSYINNLVSKRGIALIMITHSPDQAFLCATKVAVMKDGSIINIGKPEDIIDNKCLKYIYGVDVDVVTVSNQNGKSVKSCIPAFM